MRSSVLLDSIILNLKIIIEGKAHLKIVILMLKSKII